MELVIENIKTFHIKFNRLDPVYTPGDEVRGFVYIDLLREQNISGLKIMFLGRAVIKLPCAAENQEQTLVQRNNDIQIRKNGVEEYFRTEFYLLPQSNKLYSLQKGICKFPFIFDLPNNIPCSFEHEHGYIRYTVKAIIHRVNKVDVEYKIAFTVFSNYDISTPPLAGNFRKIFRNQCCTRCYLKPLDLEFLILSTAFMPGESVIVSLISHGISKRVEFEMKLEQCVYFISRISNETVKTASQFITLPTTINYEKNELEDLNRLLINLVIPSLPPSELQYCNIIDLQYHFHFIVSTEGHDDIDLSFPVEIGSFGFVELTECKVLCVSQDGTEPSVGNIVLPKYIKMLNSCDAYIDESGNFQYVLGRCQSSSTCRITNIKEEDDSEIIFGMEKSFSPIYPVIID